MIEKKDWRLVSEVTAFIVNIGGSNSSEKAVYLASPEKKSYENLIIKSIGTRVFDKISLYNNEFNIKIDRDFNIYVKSELLPDKDKYYKVLNVYSGINNSYFGEIISQVSGINKGDFGEKIFEAIFSESYPGKTFFVTNEMNLYKDAFEEMKRRLNCQMCKKTKKWIPGHRYDSLETTYYYLGKFSSRKSQKEATMFLDDNSMVNAHLIIKFIKPEWKTISDVLHEAVFENNIENSLQILYTDTLPSMVDVGKVLEDDIQYIQDFYETIIDNSIKGGAKINSCGYTSYLENLPNIFKVLSLQTPGKEYSINSSTVSKLKFVIESVLKEFYIRWWDINGSKSDSYISSNNTPEENIKNFENLFFRYLTDPNLNKSSYYTDLFNRIGLPKLSLMIQDCITNNRVDDLVFNGNLEDYIKNGSIYFETHERDSQKQSRQRVKSTNYNLKVVTIEEAFSKYSTLGETIKEMSKEAIDSNGNGVSNFTRTNLGNVKNPMIYFSLVINILDIVKHYQGVNNVPEDLKKEIIDSHFWTFNLSIDEGKEIN